MKTNKTLNTSVLALAKQYPDFRLLKVVDEDTTAVFVVNERDRIVDTYRANGSTLKKDALFFMCMFNRDYHDFSDDGKFDNCEWVYEPKKETPKKPRTRKPVPAKAKGIFSKVSGTTKSERNKSAHALILATGVKSGSDEYKSLWTKWTEVR